MRLSGRRGDLLGFIDAILGVELLVGQLLRLPLGRPLVGDCVTHSEPL